MDGFTLLLPEGYYSYSVSVTGVVGIPTKIATSKFPACYFANPLSKQETKVLTWICRGLTNRQIAEKFNLSIRTIEAHRSNMMDKLQIKGRAKLFEVAKELGIVI